VRSPDLRTQPNESGARVSIPDAPDDFWAMLGIGGMAVGGATAWMRSDTYAAMEDLDRCGCEASFEQLANQLVGNAVIMTVDFDVIVDVGANALPLCHVVGLCASVAAVDRRRPIAGSGQWRGLRAFAQNSIDSLLSDYPDFENRLFSRQGQILTGQFRTRLADE
jgi:hypothetical protein